MVNTYLHFEQNDPSWKWAPVLKTFWSQRDALEKSGPRKGHLCRQQKHGEGGRVCSHVGTVTNIVQEGPLDSCFLIVTLVSFSPLECRQNIRHTSSHGNEVKVTEVRPMIRCSMTKLFLRTCYTYVYSTQIGTP